MAAETISYFDNEELSDLKIRFGDEEIFAHRVILCRVSAYFRTLLTGDFTFSGENGKSSIELHDDHPPPVLAMLRHIYGLHYLPPSETEAGDDALLPHAQDYVVAEKYGLEDLKQAIYDTLFDDDENCSATGWMVYGDDIDATIRTIFANTPNTDRLFRPALVEIRASSLQSWGQESSRTALRTLLADTPDLAADVLFNFSQALGDTVKVYTCSVGMRMRVYVEAQSEQYTEVRVVSRQDPRDLADEIQRSGFNQRRTADIRINYSNRSILAHKAILYRASQYFRDLLDGLEPNQRQITLHENHPAALTAVFPGIYGLGWNALATRQTGPDGLSLCVEVFLTADEYGVPDVKARALELAEQGLYIETCHKWAMTLELQNAIYHTFTRTSPKDTRLRPLMRQFCHA
ncbi:hypothetical protein B0A48_13172 [Cryoendolithus antarcticus]|uniref:BTB domain-containing protein n=1 Tax=Cryoendolithus antarcticus TaxID=1507870 RepID=A0A1V8SP61_9PEZI|nr:hypothetical protein B0A48_13172 [Cryoendolithus antarcticus]